MRAAAPVDVWVVPLELGGERLAQLLGHLNSDERLRADRFHRRVDRDRFVATRGILRELLAHSLGLAPRELVITAGPNGKPVLADAADLRFNASHSAEQAVFALTTGREVGVDVERIRPVAELGGVPERTLSAAELAAWRALAPDARDAAFFASWARKEAYAKGRGVGLGLGLARIEPVPTATPGRLLVPDPAGRGRAWTVVDLDAGDRYAAAVAAEGDDWGLQLRPAPAA